jgi:hypothetical protein
MLINYITICFFININYVSVKNSRNSKKLFAFAIKYVLKYY